MSFVIYTTKCSNCIFNQAIRRDFWKRLKRKLSHQPTQLVNFEALRQTLNVYEQHESGIRAIQADHIVGSVGRFNEFDRDFMPIHKHTSHKWLDIFKLLIRDIGLPPIDVYQIDDNYFVIDGNHRVSVNGFLGKHYIDAHIIEIKHTGFRRQNHETQ